MNKDELFRLYQEGKLVLLDDDQSLPPIPNRNHLSQTLAVAYALEDMLRAGFKKVRLL